MKKLHLFIFMLSLVATNLTAQLNPGLRLTINGKLIPSANAAFGAVLDIDVPFCGEIVEVKSKGGATPTAITQLEGCDSITNAAALNGKIALVRRGTCVIADKILNIQKAGAIAVIMYENAANAVLVDMGGTNAAITVPSARITLESGTAILDELKAGKTITACMTAPSRVYNTAYGNAYLLTTPSNQSDTLTSMVTISNRNPTDTVKNVVIYSEITEPNGAKKIIAGAAEDIPPTAAGFIRFYTIRNDYKPTKAGTYKVRIFGNYAPDTLTSQFFISDTTFSADLSTLTGTGTTRTAATFAAQFKKYSHLNFYLTNNNSAKATSVTWGIINAAQMKGRPFNISVWKASEESIGKISSSIADVSAIAEEPVGDPITYEIKGTEKSLITIPLTDSKNKFIPLEENSIYILAVEYDGSAYKDSIVPQYTLGRTLPIRWPGFSVSGSAIMSGDRYFNGGWSGTDDPVGRLNIENKSTINTKSVELTAAEFSVFPNPVRDLVNINLNLQEKHQDVEMVISDIDGCIVQIQRALNQVGNNTFNIGDLPAGAYIISIRSDKGFASAKIVKE